MQQLLGLMARKLYADLSMLSFVMDFLTWKLAAAMITVGFAMFVFGISNTNIEAPSPDDFGNRFIWPAVGSFAIGITILLLNIVVGLYHIYIFISTRV
jgi:hypothetical protein